MKLRCWSTTTSASYHLWTSTVWIRHVLCLAPWLLAHGSEATSALHYLQERSDSRTSFNDQGSFDFKPQASRPETPILVPSLPLAPPLCPPSRPKSEVNVDDVDLDAELDKLLAL